MDKELSEQFLMIQDRLGNFDERFNQIDKRINETCKKIDEYAGLNENKIQTKNYQLISAIIGSPLAVLIFTWLTSLN